MNRNITQKEIAVIGIMVLIIAGVAVAVRIDMENRNLARIEERIASLEERLDIALEQAMEADEAIRRDLIREKSQEDLLTDAVADIAPSVVSIVVSKDVPKLEVVFENPFGDDPFFRDFNIQVPRYVQRGVEHRRVGAGTGFFVTSSGYIATNRHVVDDENAEYTVLLSDGSSSNAGVVYKDDDIDFAIIKIGGGGYTAASLGSSDTLKLGQSVFTVGNALGEFSNSISVGIVSGLNRELKASTRDGTEILTDVIQTDAAINLGNSGGPLADLDGNVVGINVAKALGGENIGFSIPINVIKGIIQSVIE